MADNEVIQPTAPLVDDDSRFFWEGLREDRVLMQRCGACSRVRFPPMPTCPFCRSAEIEEIDISGEGEVYSWIVARRAFLPEFAADVPYVVATVDFEEGARAAVRLDCDPDEVAFGIRVATRVKHHEDWSELRVVLQD